VCRTNIKAGNFSDSVAKYINIKQTPSHTFARQDNSMNSPWETAASAQINLMAMLIELLIYNCVADLVVSWMRRGVIPQFEALLNKRQPWY
jgi:hypothetical protein